MSHSRQAIARRREARRDPRYKGRKGKSAQKSHEKEILKVERARLRAMRSK